MKFTELNKSEFEKFLYSHPLCTFFQSPLMDLVEIKDGWQVIYLGIKENDKVIAGCRVKYATTHFNKKIFYAQRGILLDYNDKKLITFFTKSIKKYLKKMGGYVFHINPTLIYKERDIDGNIVANGEDNSIAVDNLKKLGYKHAGFINYYDYSLQNRWSFELPLKNQTEESLLKTMNGNTRRAIKKAEHLQVKIRELKKGELSIFKDIMNSTSDRRNFKDESLAYYEKMYDAFKAKDEIKYMLAYVNLDDTLKTLNEDLNDLNEKSERALAHNKIGQHKEYASQMEEIKNRIEEVESIKETNGNIINLASAMFMIYGKEIMYFHSGSYKEYFSFFGQYLIQWEMIKYAIKLKKEIYNFYGIKGVFDKKDPDYGVYLFKKGFTGRVVEYIGDFYLPLSPYYYIQKFLNFIRRK